jgi:hypothetical protein
MEAARLAALPHRRRILIWGRISSEIATRLEEERQLYAIIPTKSSLPRLALFFRRPVNRRLAPDRPWVNPLRAKIL